MAEDFRGVRHLADAAAGDVAAHVFVAPVLTAADAAAEVAKQAALPMVAS
ncbi:MAG TPA: hypothetical protein VF331_13965 [Polyangiales bacterium]